MNVVLHVRSFALRHNHQLLSIGHETVVGQEATRQLGNASKVTDRKGVQAERTYCQYACMRQCLLTKVVHMQDSFPLCNDQRPHCSLWHELLG